MYLLSELNALKPGNFSFTPKYGKQDFSVCSKLGSNSLSLITLSWIQYRLLLFHM